MRIRSLSATALAAVAALQGAGAQVAVAQKGASDGDSTSVMTTWTVTRTVERVVQTVTATKDHETLTSLVTSSITTLASASLTFTPYANGTVLGTGANPMATGSQSAQPMMPSSGAASSYAVDVLGYAAMAGVIALVAA